MFEHHGYFPGTRGYSTLGDFFYGVDRKVRARRFGVTGIQAFRVLQNLLVSCRRFRVDFEVSRSFVRP